MPPLGQVNAECFIRNVIDTRCFACGTVVQCLLKFKQSERMRRLIRAKCRGLNVSTIPLLVAVRASTGAVESVAPHN